MIAMAGAKSVYIIRFLRIRPTISASIMDMRDYGWSAVELKLKIETTAKKNWLPIQWLRAGAAIPAGPFNRAHRGPMAGVLASAMRLAPFGGRPPDLCISEAHLGVISQTWPAA